MIGRANKNNESAVPGGRSVAAHSLVDRNPTTNLIYLQMSTSG